MKQISFFLLLSIFFISTSFRIKWSFGIARTGFRRRASEVEHDFLNILSKGSVTALKQGQFINWESNLAEFRRQYLKNLTLSDLLITAPVLERLTADELNPLQLTALEIISSTMAATISQKALNKRVDLDADQKMEVVTESALEATTTICSKLVAESERYYFTDMRFLRLHSGDQALAAAYRLATVLHMIYSCLAPVLDPTSSVDELIEKWLSPVIARIQRRIPGFDRLEVKKKMAQITGSAMGNLLRTFPVRVLHSLSLHDPTQDFTLNAMKLQDTSFTGAADKPHNLTINQYLASLLRTQQQQQQQEEEEEEEEDTRLPFRHSIHMPWEFAAYYMRVLRYSLGQHPENSKELLGKLDSLLLRANQLDLSNRLKGLCDKVNDIQTRYEDSPYVSAKLHVLDEAVMKDMLKVGYDGVALCLILWHVRCNIMGKLDENGDWILDELLHDFQLTPDIEEFLRAVPQRQFEFIAYNVDEVHAELGLQEHRPILRMYSYYAHVLRKALYEELRALSVVEKAEEGARQIDRDVVYTTVLRGVLGNMLLNREHKISIVDGAEERISVFQKWLYEHLVALLTLSELIGTDEPRSSTEEGLKLGLVDAILQLKQQNKNAKQMAVADATWLRELADRVDEMILATNAILGLPDEWTEDAFRLEVFASAVDAIIQHFEEQPSRDGFETALRDYHWIAAVLSISEEDAKQRMTRLVCEHMDERLKEVLLQSASDLESVISSTGDADGDRATSLVGAIYYNPLLKLAQHASIAAVEVHRRVVAVASITYSFILQHLLSASEQHQLDRVENALYQSYMLLRHPLVRHVDAQEGKTGYEGLEGMGVAETITSTAVAILLQNFEKRILLDVIRTIDKQRSLKVEDLANANAGWGSKYSFGDDGEEDIKEHAENKEYQAYLQGLQQKLLEYYAEAK